MAREKEIILSNGDTPDYTKVEFEVFSEASKILKSFFDLVIAKDARIFDFKQKCWFVKLEVIPPFVKALEILISNGTLKNFYISDKREFLEAFKDFFHKDQGAFLEAPKLTREQLYIEFINTCALGGVSVDKGILNLNKLEHIKPYYRKAALALHPDRNNGDGSKMAALNMVWSQLQQLG
jgi:hypothetical protein